MAFVPDPNSTTPAQVVNEFTKNTQSPLFDGFGVFNPAQQPDALPDLAVSKFITSTGDATIAGGKVTIKSNTADAGLLLDYSSIGTSIYGSTGVVATSKVVEITFTAPNYTLNPMGQGLVRVYFREERHPTGEYSHDYDLMFGNGGGWTGPLMAADFIKRVQLDPYHKFTVAIKAGGGANDSIVVLTAIEAGKNYTVSAGGVAAVTTTTAPVFTFGTGAWLKASGIAIPTGTTVADTTLYKIVTMPVRLHTTTANYGLMGGRVDNGSTQGLNLTSYLVFDAGTDAIITKLSDILQGPTVLADVKKYIGKTTAALSF